MCPIPAHLPCNKPHAPVPDLSLQHARPEITPWFLGQGALSEPPELWTCSRHSAWAWQDTLQGCTAASCATQPRAECSSPASCSLNIHLVQPKDIGLVMALEYLYKLFLGASGSIFVMYMQYFLFVELNDFWNQIATDGSRTHSWEVYGKKIGILLTENTLYSNKVTTN